MRALSSIRSSEDVMEKLDRAEDSIARLVNEQTASADMADKVTPLILLPLF